MREFTRFLNGLKLINKYTRSSEIAALYPFCISISVNYRVVAAMSPEDHAQMLAWGWRWRLVEFPYSSFWEFHTGEGDEEYEHLTEENGEYVDE